MKKVGKYILLTILTVTAFTQVFAQQSSTQKQLSKLGSQVKIDNNKFVKEVIYSIIPKEKIDLLLDFTNKLSYKEEIKGLQSIFLTGFTNGEETFFSATNLSSNILKSEEASIGEIDSESIEAGIISVGDAKISNLEVENINYKGVFEGLNFVDRKNGKLVCLYIESGNIATSSGRC